MGSIDIYGNLMKIRQLAANSEVRLETATIGWAFICNSEHPLYSMWQLVRFFGLRIAGEILFKL